MPKHDKKMSTADIEIFMPDGSKLSIANAEKIKAKDDCLQFEDPKSGLKQIYAGMPYSIKETEFSEEEE